MQPRLPAGSVTYQFAPGQLRNLFKNGSDNAPNTTLGIPALTADWKLNDARVRITVSP
jgi:hypothetical protein